MGSDRSAPRVWLATAVLAVVLAALSSGLRPDAWTSGDSGLKYLAARDALRHPASPLRHDLPTVGGEPRPWVDHMVRVHDGHAHILQSPIFPLLTAPLLGAFGPRGVYVLPALAFVVLLPITCFLLRATGHAPPVPAVIVATTVASPVFFYALEFWEHVPAVALLGVSTWALVVAPARPVVAGVCAAVATLLRPEALVYIAVLWAIRGPWRHAVRFATALMTPLLAFAAWNLAESGSPLGPHAATAMSLWPSQWAAAHAGRFMAWTGLGSPVIAASLLALLAMRVWPARGSRDDALRVAGLVAAVMLAVAAALDGAGSDALWRAWPIGAVLFVRPVSGSPFRRHLELTAIVTSVLVWAGSTHDGGAQWGPRFLLISTPALVALTALALADLTGPGRWRTARSALAWLLVLASAWNTRAAYLDLRGTKEVYATLVQQVRDHVPEGAIVITDAWWLNQVAASLDGTRTFLTTESGAEAPAILAALEQAGIRDATLIWSDDTGEPGTLAPVLSGSCWRGGRPQRFRERRLTLLPVHCAP